MARKPGASYVITAEDKTAAALRQAKAGLSDLTNVTRTATLALGSVVGVASIGQVARMADEFNGLSTRLRTATRDTGDFVRVQQALLQASIATGAEFETTVDTFQALARVRDDIGATNDQMIVLTETVQKLGVIGGTSGEAMSAGLRQFNQAIAAGVFRAEEFNSIVENVPELARRIADGFGVTQGALRQMVLDGQLFSADVINVLLRQAPEIADQFEEIPTTLDRAFESLRTSIGAVVSELDRAVGLTTTLAQKMQEAASAADIWQRNLRLSTIADEIGRLEDLVNTGKAPKSFGQRVMDAIGLGEDAVAEGLLPGAEERIRARIAQLVAERDALLNRPAAGKVGEVTGGEGVEVEMPKGVEAAGRRRFEQMIAEEAKLLETQRELRIRGMTELATAIADEETRLKADELARALGYQDALAQAQAEREAELFVARMEARARQWEEELALELGYKSARDMQIEQAEEAHQDRLLAARTKQFGQYQKQAIELLKFESKTAREKTTYVLGQAASLTAGLAQNSKTAFNLNKAVSIAEAIINTSTGVTAALRLGPKGIPLAALIAAQGAAQIATIQSTQFGGAATGYTGGGPSSGIPSMADDLFKPPTVTDAERNNSTIRLEISADDSELARALVKSVRVVTDQEDVILASSSSRQALEFAR